MAQSTESDTIVPTEALNPLGQHFERRFFHAWTLFESNEFSAANTIAKDLLHDSRVGKLHRAGCHLILAHSPDNYLHHAEQAVTMFTNLYSGSDADLPTESQKQSQDELIAMAERALETAKADAQLYAPCSDAPHRRTRTSSRKPPEQRINRAELRSILEQRRQASR